MEITGCKPLPATNTANDGSSGERPEWSGTKLTGEPGWSRAPVDSREIYRRCSHYKKLELIPNLEVVLKPHLRPESCIHGTASSMMTQAACYPEVRT